MVQRLRVGRGRTKLAEVVGRADDPFTEVMLPDTVHHRPRREWVGRAGDPTRQFSPAAAVLDRELIITGDGRRKVTGDDLTELVVRAADVDRYVLYAREHRLGRA